MNYHDKREKADLIHLLPWLGIESMPTPCTPEQILEMVESNANQNLFPHVERSFGIIEIARIVRIVDQVQNPNTEIALKHIPFEMLDVPRIIGNPW